MRLRSIGSLQVSAVGVGCNNFGGRIGRQETEAVVAAALEAGVTLFDTADTYGGAGRSEELLGAALGSRRDDVVIATKFGMQVGEDAGKRGAHPEYVKRACEDSLRRLGTDRIDLYQLHTPDDGVPLEDTLAALTELRDAGKVVEIGCSNFTAGLIDEALGTAASRGLAAFASVQNSWNLLDRVPETDGVVAACERHGLRFLPYYPLALGMLTGKYRRDEGPPEGTRLAKMPAERSSRQMSADNFDKVEALERFCAERGRSLLELAISWLASQPVVASVIAGATKPGQVRANVAAASWELTPEELAEIDRLVPAEG
jgi:aryl-alcohol dehydrogenase-like predicted oxidoreductase